MAKNMIKTKICFFDSFLAYCYPFSKRRVFMSVYDFQVETIDGKETSLADYRGNVLLIVNTASKCGFTPQFKGLQQLYDTFKGQGFYVLGFPCNQFNNQDPGSEEEIAEFCQLNYGVTFPMFRKIDVKGEQAHPLFQYLTEEVKGMFTKQIKWNFTKFLINKQGEVINRYAPQTKPEQIKKDIEATLKK
ncbi:glutathione peroxidase [Virgibacillus pantothenticus]|nr:glutathione peroxidase [Virgibacillus pantothenticus]